MVYGIKRILEGFGRVYKPTRSDSFSLLGTSWVKELRGHICTGDGGPT